MTFKELIKDNINKHGYHITIVTDGAEPRYAYTVGVSEKIGFELIFAGGIYYMKDEVFEIIDSIIDKVRASSITEFYQVNDLGTFKLSKAHQSWSSLMALGIFDFYQKRNIEVFQIIPDPEHFTMDIPDMTGEWIEDMDPVWKWLTKEWNYPVSKNSKVITNINSMQGEKITEVIRWEDDEWEGFVGSIGDVGKDDIRIVSLGTMIGIDSSLLPILDLDIGNGFWRDSNELKWHKWESS